MKKILIIGATSSIAENAARIWASRGDELILIGRNKSSLELIANDLRVRGASRVFYFNMDVNCFNEHASMLNKACEVLGWVDIVLIAHGTLSNQVECESSVELTLKEISTNALSVISFLTLIANYFENRGDGVIAIISSVAGDRGRKSNYVYGSAKAMVSAFASGLRQRLYKSNVCVLTIKPGFVDTPMTENFKKNFLWASPLLVSRQIVRGIDLKKDEIYTPSFWWFVMNFIKHIPAGIFKKMDL